MHYQQNYDNAFWNGQQMVYGDGDGDLFNRFTIAIDVMGHELSHGVTQYEAALVYSYQPGALNESMSDVFGSLVKQRHLGQTAAQADWLIGEGLFTAKVKGVALRSMKAPGTAYDDPVLGKDPQPAHMKDYVNTISDNGGVHINSGIPNHAFYAVAVEIGGNAWEKAGRIWYVTLRDKLSANSQFLDCARLTYQTAGELYGDNSLEQQAVRKVQHVHQAEDYGQPGSDQEEQHPLEQPGDRPPALGTLERFAVGPLEPAAAHLALDRQRAEVVRGRRVEPAALGVVDIGRRVAVGIGGRGRHDVPG